MCFWPQPSFVFYVPSQTLGASQAETLAEAELTRAKRHAREVGDEWG